VHSRRDRRSHEHRTRKDRVPLGAVARPRGSTVVAPMALYTSMDRFLFDPRHRSILISSMFHKRYYVPLTLASGLKRVPYMLMKYRTKARMRTLIVTGLLLMSFVWLVGIAPGPSDEDGSEASIMDVRSDAETEWIPETYYLRTPPDIDTISSLAIDTLDVNGDGIDDILTHCSLNDTYPRARGPKNCVILGSWDRDLANSTVIIIDNVSHSFAIGDVNGDGYDEIASYPYPSYNEYHYYPQVGAPTTLLIRFGGPDGPSTLPDQEIGLECDIAPVEGKPIFTTVADIGDVNNDGYDEIVVLYRLANETRDHRTEEAEMQVFYGTSSGLPSDPSWSEPMSQDFIDNRTNLAGISPGDYNGDGYGDMLGFCGKGSSSASTIEVRYGSDDGISVTPDTILETGNHYSYVQWRQAPIDYDGDGYDDVGVHYQGHSGDTTRNQVHIFKGSSRGLTKDPGRVRSYNFTGYSPLNWPRTMFADYNADGLHEMVVHNLTRTDSGYTSSHGQTIWLNKVDIEIFPNEGGRYPKTPRSTTYDLGFHWLYPIHVADMDGDNADDLLVLRNFGGLERDDGPDIPPASGVWIIYGEGKPRVGGPVKYNGGDRVYAGLRSYDFLAGVNPATPSYYDKVRITLDPGGANVKFTFHPDLLNGTYFDSVVHEYARLNTKDAVIPGPSGGFMWINFSVLFDWDWPHEDPCDVVLEYLKDDEVEYSFTTEDLFSVENDLDLIGSLEVVGDIKGPLDPGDWVVGGEPLTVRGVMVVYEGSTDVYPPNGTCTVALLDDDGDKALAPIVRGGMIELTLSADTTTDTDETLLLTLEDMPGTAELASTRSFALRVDADLPRWDRLIPDSDDWISTSEVTFHVVVNDTGSSGPDISSLEYSFKGPSTTTGWTSNGLDAIVMGHKAEGTITLDLADGSDYWVRWRVRDIAGNWNETEEMQVRVDTRNVTFTNPIPSGDKWQNSTPVRCGITIRDLEGSGIDVSTIEYRVSPRNLSKYGPWVPLKGEDEDATLVNIHIFLNLTEGPYNSIQWRTADIAGNGLTVSRHYRVMVDTDPVSYSGFSPTIIQSSSDVAVSIRVHVGPNESDIDATSCMFRYSRGGGEYSRWISAEIEAVGNEYLLSAFLEGLVDGEDNRVQFHVYDMARNGPAISPEYRVLVDTTGPEFIEVLPREGEVQADPEVPCLVSVHDDFSGLDPAMVQYRYSTTGEEGWGTWMPLEVEAVEDVFKGSIALALARGRRNVIELRATDMVGNTAVTGPLYIWVNQLPIAHMTLPDGLDNITAGEPLPVTAEGSLDPDGDQLVHEWYIDGSTEPMAKGMEATLTLGYGEHILTLRIRDDHGGMAESEAILNVKRPDDDHGVEDSYWGWLTMVVIVSTLLMSALYVRYRKDREIEG